MYYAFPLGGFQNIFIRADEEIINADSQNDTDIICEDVAKREKYVKYFLKYDGSYIAAVYKEPVHYLDSKGAWQQYDNSLIESNTLLPESLRDYSIASSDMDIRLSKKAKSNKMISIEDIGLSWGYSDIENSTAYIKVDDEEIKDYKNKELSVFAVENASSKVVYPEIYMDTDLEVVINSQGVKENIILNTSSAQHSFVIEYAQVDAIPDEHENYDIESEKRKAALLEAEIR